MWTTSRSAAIATANDEDWIFDMQYIYCMSLRLAPALAATLAATLFAAAAWGQIAKLQTSVKHRPTFVDADFGQIASSLGELTSRTFELEPGVCAQVTASWDKPLTAQEFYQAFLDIARALGYVVAEQGLVTKISLAPETPKDPRPACRRYPIPTGGRQ
jgi:type II secretory pathway component GspD/PulD (secretin)